MKLFDCSCHWRFIVGRKQVYGPIYALDLPGHFTGPNGCHTRGRMMTREQFEDQYGDCALRFERQETGIYPVCHEDCSPGSPCRERGHPKAGLICYEPHFDRKDQGLPNLNYLPHVHAPEIDYAGRVVKLIWEKPAGPPSPGGMGPAARPA